ncbi:MAG: Mov34/MPN/PAD-1 family protein, partial [Planctomycetota bacterium]
YYHSHPGAEPCFSAEDASLVAEGAVYVVVGGTVNSPRTRAWKLNGGGCVEEPLDVEEGSWPG